MFKIKSCEPYQVLSVEIAMHLNFYSTIKWHIFLVLILKGYLLWSALIY